MESGCAGGTRSRWVVRHIVWASGGDLGVRIVKGTPKMLQRSKSGEWGTPGGTRAARRASLSLFRSKLAVAECAPTIYRLDLKLNCHHMSKWCRAGCSPASAGSAVWRGHRGDANRGSHRGILGFCGDDAFPYVMRGYAMMAKTRNPPENPDGPPWVLVRPPQVPPPDRRTG